MLSSPLTFVVVFLMSGSLGVLLLIGQVPFSSMSGDRAAELLEQQRRPRVKV